MYYRVWLPMMVFLLLTACAGQGRESPPPSPFPEDPNATPLPAGTEGPPHRPYDPGKGDESMTRGEVFIDSQEIVVLESLPPQFRLRVTGSLPSPCHQLRAVVEEPNEQNQIHVEVYALVDPNTACAQVMEPFAVTIFLDGNYTGQAYTVFVNGNEVGDIQPVPAVRLITPTP